MLQASRGTRWCSQLRRRGLVHSPPCGCALTVLFALSLFILLPPVRADHRPISHRAVPLARVESHVLRLPVINGTDLRFKRFSTAEGLSQIKVSQILQDAQGFMWFGTQYGLNRYDAYNFKVFAHDPRNPNSLSGVFVGALFKDRHGILWIGCGQFLNRFEPETETFTRYPIQLVNHISQDSAGALWLATGKGLHSLDPATGRIRQYSHDPKDPSSLSSNDVKSSGEDKMGRFWVANSEGLDEFDRKTGKVTLHVPLREPLREFSFYEDRFGVFWIIHVSGNGLAVFDRRTNTLTHYSFHDREPPSTAVTGVMAILEDKTGNLWLGTQGAGLLKFDRERRRFVRYRNNPADPESLAQDRVISLYEDREGNIWAGLGGMGPTRFSSKPPPFQKFPYDLGNPHSKGETFVAAIYEDRQGILWLGTREALNRIDRKTGQYAFYRTSDPGIGSDVISIVEDRSGVLWVGTFNHGLHRFDRRTRQFKTYRHNASDPYSLSNDIVPRLLVDRKGTLWAATWDGLNRFDAATERFTSYKLDPLVRDLFYLELVEDPQGMLWLGTHSSGLHRFDPATGRFTVYEHQLSRPGSLSDNRVNSVRFDRSGTVWVGTQNGLNRFDPRVGTFTVYTKRDGLSGNAVGCVLEDERGDLWISTNDGVSRFNPLTETFQTYSTADGLPGPDLTGWGACFRSSNGEMFFGGFSGATSFHPDQVVDSSYTPPIALTDLRLFGKPVEIGIHTPLQRSLSYATALALSHEQNVFSLEFSALSYLNPTTTRYRYKLEGTDRQWNEVGSDQRVVTYNSLPPGAYMFRVQGAESRGRWSEPGVALRVEILPPWWSTWWFRVSCGLVCGISIAGFYRFRLHQLTRRLNVLFEERLAERTRIAQELHDTLLQGFLSASMQLHVVADQVPADSPAKSRFGRVLQLMEQVIEEGRSAVRGLRSSSGDSYQLEQGLSRIPQELAIEEPIDFRVVVEGQPRPLHPVIRDEVFRIGREGIVNALRHSGAKKIEVELEYARKHLRVLVRDNGCGIDVNVLQSGREGHWGLTGMRERAERIGARLKIMSRATAGTEVELLVSSHIAFQHQASDRVLGWLAKIYPRSTRAGDSNRS
jgi:ligand-binding sensor domain-containing protein/signal transduction histidine kinase